MEDSATVLLKLIALCVCKSLRKSDFKLLSGAVNPPFGFLDAFFLGLFLAQFFQLIMMQYLVDAAEVAVLLVSDALGYFFIRLIDIYI